VEFCTGRSVRAFVRFEPNFLSEAFVKYCWLLAAGQKGLFEAMSTGSESSVWVPVIQKGCIGGLSADGGRSLPAKRAFTPWALIGLALAVALWGFGYKLSRYSPHLTAAARLSYTKLWDKHQDAPQVLTLKSTAHPQRWVKERTLSAVSHQQASQRPYFLLPACKDDKSTIVEFPSFIPSRSPPSRAFLA
jgi:hypothetical protein